MSSFFSTLVMLIHKMMSFDQRTNDLQLDTHGTIPVHDASQNYIEQAALEEPGEVIRYLEGELIPQNANFDILKWWKENASTYPALARLARDILAIPGSAVSAESAFDEADERASLFNRKLSPELVEALICTQDWIKSSGTYKHNSSSFNLFLISFIYSRQIQRTCN